MNTSTYYLEIKSQHSVGSGGAGKFGGPDTYVAVQIVPQGESPLASLQRRAAKRRGIVIKYFGEGYASHRGPRSMLGKAILAAREYIAQQKGKTACN